MKSLIRPLFLGAALFAASLSASAQNISISVGQPGYYGHIDIGGYGAPRVISQRPIIIHGDRHSRAQPIYLRVPPGHRSNWTRNCHRYNACGRPVLFVRDDWYMNSYAPRYRQHHAMPRHEMRPPPRGPRHDPRDRHDGPGRGHDRAPGPGPGYGPHDGRGR